MIYFLINNNYHLDDFNLLYKDIYDQKISLIQIPYSLNVLKEDSRFSCIYTYKYFNKGMFSLLKLRKIKSTHSRIDSELRPQKNDVLFVYTEYELLNQYIIEKFKKNGAAVFILEDGMATCILFNLVTRKLPFLQKINLAYINYILGYKNTSILFDGKNYSFQINDSFIDGVCFYINAPIKRNIKTYIIQNNTSLLESLNTDSAIFLNQGLFKTISELEELKCFIEIVSQNFNFFYFKFHPRETETKRKEIKTILQNCTNVLFIDSNASVETLITELRPKFAISDHSAALKSLFFYGIEPVFVYHLLSSMKGSDVCESLNNYLGILNYNFVPSVTNINKNYKSNLIRLQNNFSIRNLIIK